MRSTAAFHRVAVMLAVICVTPVAHATLIGAEVKCAFAPSSLLSCDSRSAIVSSSQADFVLVDRSDTPRLSIDISSNSIFLSVPADFDDSIIVSGFPGTLFLSDLRWVDFPDAELAGAILTRSNVLEQTDIEVLSDAATLSVDMRGNWIKGQSFANILLQTNHIPVPEPRTLILTWIGIAGSGLVTMAYRTRQRRVTSKARVT